MGLFKPAWQSGNSDKALKAVAKENDPKTLVQIIVNSDSWAVKQAALSKLTDENMLAEAALETGDYSIYEAIITKMEDVNALERLAGYENGRTRGREEEYEYDGGQLSTYREVRYDSDKCRAAAQRQIERIALTSTSIASREAAVRLIEDKSVLAQVAKQDKEYSVCALAMGKLPNLSFYSHYLIKAVLPDVRIEGIKSLDISDAWVVGTIQEIVENEAHIQVFHEAVKKLTDEKVLKEIVLSPARQGVFKNIPLNGIDLTGIRQSALKNITEPAFLEKIARMGKEELNAITQDVNNGLRIIAIENISDQATLKRLWKHFVPDGAFPTRMTMDIRPLNALIGKMTDCDFIKGIMQNCGSDIEDVARSRLVELQDSGVEA